MSRNVLNRIARGAGIASVLVMSPMAANAANINLSVASNFYISFTAGNSPIYDLIAAFTADPAHSGDTITVVENGSTGTLEQNIINGNSNDVDLFLAADTDHPNHLAASYPGLVVGSPIVYAIGTLTLWSKTVSVSGGYNPTTFPNVAIADPSTAPYGKAAETLITGRYGLPLSGNVQEYPNINLTFDAVDAGTNLAGFVALSQVCSGGSWPTSGYALPYPSTDVSVSPHVFNYSPINQAAVKINRSRSPDEGALLTDFVAYLQDHSTSPSNSQMVTTLLNYCYEVPSP